MDSIVSNRAESKILHGDSLIVLRDLPSESVDAVITDPPYCSGGRTSAERTSRSPIGKYQQSGVQVSRPDFGGDSRDQRSYLAWCALWLAECLRVARPGSPIAVFCDWRQLPVTTDAIQAGGWLWRGIAVWDKTGAARPQKGRFTAQAEYIVWGSKGAMSADRGVGVLPGVFSHCVRQADKHHLTGKPTPLMRDLVRIVKPNGVVLDPFAGSGTTGVAAKEAGLGYILIEQLGDNVETARRRLDEASAVRAT